MHRCKSGRHLWLRPDDAERCCHPLWQRLLVLNPGPGDRTTHHARDAEAETSYGRKWAHISTLDPDSRPISGGPTFGQLLADWQAREQHMAEDPDCNCAGCQQLPTRPNH